MCAFWVLIQKILKKDPPFLFFPLVGGGCGNACVCVCKAFCVDCLSVFACEATKSKNLRWRAPRDGKDDARTHTTHIERERECRHYVAALVLAPPVCVCVCVRVCSDVPFAVDFSLSQIGKMVLALLDRGGCCCCCCLLQPKGKTQQTGNKQETNTQKQRRLVTQDTRTYTAHKAFVCYIICVIIMSHALCVEQKGGKKENKGKGGETRKQQQQHDGNT